MTLQIFNTLSREKENFKPKNIEHVKVYYCGPTPYNYAHIGNLKTYVFEDIVIRGLKFLGYKVTTTMNITDIEDKIIKESLKTGENFIDFTRRYANIFFEDIAKLLVEKADNIEYISDSIPEMIQIINGLIKKGYAYIADDNSIYYSIKKFPNYGKLAHLDLGGMKTSVRINNDEYDKEVAADFVLWKAYDEKRDGQIFWEGKFMFDTEEKNILGRPGWHIECSACSLKFLGPEIDLHMGGIDLVFPHHQNEIAQSEAYTGKKFSRYWMHSGHLLVNGKKMSKSLHNFYTLRDIENHFKDIDATVLYRAIRLSFITGKYRDTVDFSFEKLEQQINTIKKIDETVKKLLRLKESVTEGTTRKQVSQNLQILIADFIQNIEDDFNTPEALAVFFDAITFINSHLGSQQITTSEIQAFIDFLKTLNQILGIVSFDVGNSLEIPQEINELFELRNVAKKEKDFQKADEIREKLTQKGYKIVDDRSGSRLEKI